MTFKGTVGWWLCFVHTRLVLSRAQGVAGAGGGKRRLISLALSSQSLSLAGLVSELHRSLSLQYTVFESFIHEGLMMTEGDTRFLPVAKHQVNGSIQ